jgi:class 3 adenylate cyclase
LRSLQVKFSILVVALLVLACVSLTSIATQHERRALENEIEKRARALAMNLAGAAKEAVLGVDQGDFEGELTLERLIEQTSQEEGVVAVRLVTRDGIVAASLDPKERGSERAQFARPVSADEATPPGDEPEPVLHASQSGGLLLVEAPILYSGVLVGVAEVELDLRILVDPVVQSSTSQLASAAIAVVCLGVVAGMIFVALLVGPLRRLRLGVERLADGELDTRVPPTSRDEIGDLTRAFNEMGNALEQKQRVQNAFGRYVNDFVLNQLLEGDDQQFAGLEQEITILFVDIRQFTRLSEGMKARDVVMLLNEVFQLASDRILENGGTIDKFIGDSVMAYFGAPVRHSDHALRGVTDSPFVPVQFGIGIHSGMVVVGNIGSDRRTDFTAVGDAVNVAHRLEKLAKAGQILVSEAVQRCVRAAVRLDFEGERQLSGREEPVHVYRVDIDSLATRAPGPKTQE